MENAIAVLEDEIVFILGKIKRLDDQELHQLTRETLTNSWFNQIEELEEAKEILDNV